MTLDKVENTLDSFSKALLVVAAIAMLGLLAIVLLDVTLRYAINQPVQGTLQIVSFYCMGPLVFFSFAYVEHEKRHVAISILTDVLSAKLQRWTSIFSGAAGFFYLCYFTYNAIHEAIKKTRIFEASTTLNFDIHVWIVRWVPPIGMGLMALMLLVGTLKIISNAQKET
ncbi:MAG: TRAP transporter small permease [Marinosulfonomonas sp.]|nr:TRAP transporter small permease [Marinosulfonomonas sp.]